MAEIKIPFLGDGIDSATVISILVQPGDTVEIEQTLVELETDKATAPVPATEAGTIETVHLKEGDVVKTGDTVVTVSSTSGSGVSDTAESKPVILPPHQVAQSSPQSSPQASDSVLPPSGQPGPTSPSIRKMARISGLDLARVQGSGKRGRITWPDIQHYLTCIQSGAGQLTTQTSTQTLSGSSSPPPKPSIDFSKWGQVRKEKMPSLRSTIASHLHHAWSTIPHVTQFDTVDITHIMALRKTYNPQYKKKKTNLTVTVFALKAMVAALKAFPIFNTSYDENTRELVHKSYFHIGVAVDTEAGLIVPVIQNVDQKSMLDLSIELTTLAEKARQRQLGLEDLRGGCTTISNLGGLGVGAFTPIVNHPEVAILGIGKGAMTPVFESGEWIPRLQMPIAISYDHRVIDGADGARFTRTLVDTLESFSETELKGKKSS